MKKIPILPAVAVFIFIITVPAFPQAGDALFIADDRDDRLTALQSTITIKEIDADEFWSIYHQYTQERPVTASHTYFSESADSIDAHSCVNEILKSQLANLSLKRQYFDKINESLNGTLALQFLQSEALLDLIVKSQSYENKSWKQPQWRPEMMEDADVKMFAMEKSLALTKEQALRFRSLFVEFEFDYSRIVGHRLAWFEQYVEDITDLTPAQCKKLGKEFLTMQQNELRLLEKMFKSMHEAFGDEVALTYMALEDYFTMAAKLRTWDIHLLASR